MLTPPLREKATIVFDMTGFGLANMDWKCILFIVKCLEAYYPEVRLSADRTRAAVLI